MRTRLILTITFSLFFIYKSYTQKVDLSNSLRKHVEVLASDSLEGRGIGTLGKQKAQDYIIQQFRTTGLTPFDNSYIHYFERMADLARVECNNIIGKIEGTHPSLKDEYIVIGAHYDHLGWRDKEDKRTIYNGADDNASGTATIIELARLLSKEKMKRSIVLVAFDGEESGLWGSEQFLIDSIVNPSQIKIMFSLDMVGMYKKYGGVDFKGLDLLVDGTKMLNNVNKKGIIIRKTGTQKENYTDTKSFLDKNIPAAHVFTGLKSPYHKPEDTAEKLDYEGMASICELMHDFSIYLSNQDKLIPNKIIKETFNPDPVFAVGYNIGIGTSHLSYKGRPVRSKNNFSFETGVTTELKLTNVLFLSTDFLYEYSKNKLNFGNFNLHSITVPIQLKLKTAYHNEYSPRLYTTAGIYYSYHFAENIESDVSNLTKDDIKNDNGICFGFGLEFKRINLAYNWRIGTQEMINKHNLYSLRRNSSKFSVGYKF